MSIARICQREVDLAEAEETTQVAAKRMEVRSVGSLIILDGRRRPVGIVTDRDLATHVCGQGLDPGQVRVSDVMSPNPTSVTEDSSIEKALDVMRSVAVRRLPVVDEDGGLVGVVTLDDILLLMADDFGQLRALLTQSSPRLLAGS